MRRWSAAVLVCICVTTPAAAQEPGSPETLRTAQDLAAVVSPDTMAQITRTMTAQVWPAIEAQFAGKVDAATLAELRTVFERETVAFATDSMKALPAIYAKYFSAKELQELLAFYRTPVGAKGLKFLPQVTADIGASMAPKLPAFQAQITAQLEEVLRRHGYRN